MASQYKCGAGDRDVTMPFLVTIDRVDRVRRRSLRCGSPLRGCRRCGGSPRRRTCQRQFGGVSYLRGRHWAIGVILSDGRFAPASPAPIPSLSRVDAGGSALDTVIGWSITTSSRLGYFAAMYKRITIAVGVAVKNGAFQDGPRMERFDATFASRYFDALNGNFHPNEFPRPTQAWQRTFDAADRDDLIILQHMLAGVNAHIDLDLGIAAQNIAPAMQLPKLHDDFNTINAVLASQVTGVLDDVDRLSPDWRSSTRSSPTRRSF